MDHVRFSCMWTSYRESGAVGQTRKTPPSNDGDATSAAIIRSDVGGGTSSGLVQVSEFDSTPGFHSAVYTYFCNGGARASDGGLFLFRRHIRPCWSDLCTGGHFRVEQPTTAATSTSTQATHDDDDNLIRVVSEQVIPFVSDVLEEKFVRSVAIAGVGITCLPGTPSRTIQLSLWTLSSDSVTVEALRKEIISRRPSGCTIRFIHHDTVPKDILEQHPPPRLTLTHLLSYLANRGISLAELPSVTVEDVSSSLESESFFVNDRSPRQTAISMDSIPSVANTLPQPTTLPPASQRITVPTSSGPSTGSTSLGLPLPGVKSSSGTSSVRRSSSINVFDQRHQSSDGALVSPTPVTDWAASWSPTMFFSAQQHQQQPPQQQPPSETSRSNPLTGGPGVTSSTSSESVKDVMSSIGSATSFSPQNPVILATMATGSAGAGVGGGLAEQQVTYQLLQTAPGTLLTPGSATAATPSPLAHSSSGSAADAASNRSTTQMFHTSAPPPHPVASISPPSAVGSASPVTFYTAAQPAGAYQQPQQILVQHHPQQVLVQQHQHPTQVLVQQQPTQVLVQQQQPPQPTGYQFATLGGDQYHLLQPAVDRYLHQPYNAAAPPPAPQAAAFYTISQPQQPYTTQQYPPQPTYPPPFQQAPATYAPPQQSYPPQVFQQQPQPAYQQVGGPMVPNGGGVPQQRSPPSYQAAGFGAPKPYSAPPPQQHWNPSIQIPFPTTSMPPPTFAPFRQGSHHAGLQQAPPSSSGPHWLPQSDRKAFVFRGYVFPPGLNRKEYRQIVHHTELGADVGSLNGQAFPAPPGMEDGDIERDAYNALAAASRSR